MNHMESFLARLGDDRVIQGPMAGYSDRAFRHIMIEHGCRVTTTEMVSVEGMVRNGEKTLELLRLADNETPDGVVVQFFGADPHSYSKAVEMLLKSYRPLCIDINAGCSVRKVVKTGSGVALMSDPKKAGDIIKAVKSVDGTLCVSIKFRLGLTFDSINYIDFAHVAVDSGADILTLHPRTASQGFSGVADHSRTAALKKKIPESIVVASGDVMTVSDIARIRCLSDCDCVMVARGAIGNPFIFEQKDKLAVHSEERVSALYRHYALLKHYEGERRAECLVRKFVKGYSSGIRGFSFCP